MNILVLLPFWDFISKVLNILDDVYSDEKVCYITLNKPYRVLSAEFRKAGIAESRIFVIDAVTKSVIPSPKEVPNCTYIDAPASVQEMENILKQVIRSNSFGVVVLDSISTLLIYHPEEEIFSQIRKLSNIIELLNCEGVFTTLKEEINEEMMNKLGAVMDKVVDLT